MKIDKFIITMELLSCVGFGTLLSSQQASAATWHNGMPDSIRGVWKTKVREHTLFYLWNIPSEGSFTKSRSFFNKRWYWGNETDGIFGKTKYKVINQNTYMLKAKNKENKAGYAKAVLNNSKKITMKYYGEGGFTSVFYK
ncbi:hypothetical protein [Lentilactobacillus hilgardii]|jgi:hypothetical protein|uniref:Uncharacterized protein n=1 Tax=Lentilactobacillus hilgardii TaxID=1588 RepID=A0A6P1E2H6_LENHI|nr:hypothetical protein [Lentilactobacillus hilgardii]EEI71780.1 hypothetical protein HMPREF0496_0970 [Lentilactobacillus hilgardii ATCC 27305]MCT3393089.1 hypothetical protein [Lentilactobacillus hilgardii]QHB51357.1 hypothetical protein GQR93_03565 [Lentilactobacillus hilgardii]RRG10341.1 MAG: hypothetical protein DUD35_08015 [Lactobacillus sp.]